MSLYRCTCGHGPLRCWRITITIISQFLIVAGHTNRSDEHENIQQSKWTFHCPLVGKAHCSGSIDSRHRLKTHFAQIESVFFSTPPANAVVRQSIIKCFKLCSSFCFILPPDFAVASSTRKKIKNYMRPHILSFIAEVRLRQTECDHHSLSF